MATKRGGSGTSKRTKRSSTRGAKRTQGAAPAALTEYRRKRDFTKTAEPAGGAASRRRAKGLQFVIQKHAASHLHFDLRLELDGVMKSWAVPRGPSSDPADKRLAMEVEDHPIEYNTFEGTIPQGEYGGGTVMLWDRGTYHPDEAKPGEEPAKALRREYHAGRLKITFEGERMRGSYALVRTDGGAKPKWLLIKHRDGYARRGSDLVAEHVTSVVTGRTMDEIAEDRDQVWRSNRPPTGRVAADVAPAGLDPDAIRPMRAQPARKLPEDERIFQAWRGGERVLVFATPQAAAVIDERGRARTGKVRELAEALQSFSERVGEALVLDGEVVESGKGATLYVLDILLRGDQPLAPQPWEERRAALESLLERRRIPGVKLADTADDAALLLRRDGVAGVFARRPGSVYKPGKKTDDLVRVPTPAKYRK